MTHARRFMDRRFADIDNPLYWRTRLPKSWFDRETTRQHMARVLAEKSIARRPVVSIIVFYGARLCSALVEKAIEVSDASEFRGCAPGVSGLASCSIATVRVLLQRDATMEVRSRVGDVPARGRS